MVSIRDWESARDVISADRGVTDIPLVAELCSSWRRAHTLRSSSWHSHESVHRKGIREEVSHPYPSLFYLTAEFPQGELRGAHCIAELNTVTFLIHAKLDRFSCESWTWFIHILVY